MVHWAVMGIEYTAVDLPIQRVKDGAKAATDLLNDVASYGWRLVTVDDHTAYFEREKTE